MITLISTTGCSRVRAGGYIQTGSTAEGGFKRTRWVSAYGHVIILVIMLNNVFPGLTYVERVSSVLGAYSIHAEQFAPLPRKRVGKATLNSMRLKRTNAEPPSIINPTSTHDRSSLQSALRGDARDRRYAHHNVGRPATGGTHAIHLSAAAAAAAVAALAGAVVHELARPAQSGFLPPAAAAAAAAAGCSNLFMFIHVVVVAVARSRVHFLKQTPLSGPSCTALSTVDPARSMSNRCAGCICRM